MVNPFETSFVPQQPLLKVEGVSRRGETMNAALIIAIIIFFVAAVVAASAYFYKLQVLKRISANEQELDVAEKYFNIDEIDIYKRADVRLSTAKQMVDSHTIFSVIFDLLETSTAQNVGLTSFSFTKNTKDYTVGLSGQAPSYAAVYFQVESWRALHDVVKSAVVNGMSLNEDTGIVTFGVTFVIDPKYVEAANVIAAKRHALSDFESSREVLPASMTSTSTTKRAVSPATTTVVKTQKP